MTPAGLYCEAGDFYVDPTRAVDRAVVTHAHSDHARPGSRAYLAASPGLGVLQARVGGSIQGLAYGKRLQIGDALLSLHPAGHILGSAQVRVEVGGVTWVVTGDYKVEPDPTCEPWTPVRCDTFVTECTFGLPIYRWPDTAGVFDEINRWWADAAAEGRTAILFGYSLGKAQRLIAGVDPGIGPIRTHDVVEPVCGQYRKAGIALPPTRGVSDGAVEPGSLVVAPPGAGRTSWKERLGPATTAFASGWMQLRSRRRQQGFDRGFVVSDHVDWPSLLQAIELSGARRVLPTHGATAPLVRFLRERGLLAEPLRDRSRSAAGEGGRA